MDTSTSNSIKNPLTPLTPLRSSRQERSRQRQLSIDHQFASMARDISQILQLEPKKSAATLRSSESHEELASATMSTEKMPERRNASAPNVMGPDAEARQHLVPAYRKGKSGPITLRDLESRQDSLVPISTIYSDSSRTTPVSARTAVARSAPIPCNGHGHCHFGTGSPKLLSDLGPLTQTPTLYPSPRVNRQESGWMAFSECDPGLRTRSSSKVLVEEDILKIRELHPWSCLNEEEDEGDNSTDCT